MSLHNHHEEDAHGEDCCHHHDHNEMNKIDKELPSRRIFCPADMEDFIQSDLKRNILDFVLRLNESIKGVPNNSEIQASENVTSIVKIIERFQTIVKETPPRSTRSRFGNAAFQEWITKIEDCSLEYQTFIPKENIEEVNCYLLHSFGNKDRIDYGTGHEANFLCYLYCLELLGIIDSKDYKAIVILVFRKYIQLMRDLQLNYWLEPAGSHGIWGLDDYHFLPFLFGSAQLIGHKYIQPRSIRDKEFVEDFACTYMYVDCIKFINSVKSESLPWHSPMLYDISGVKTWQKVNEGLIKMYEKEVFSKLPIMQHFLFGKLLHFLPSSYLNMNEEERNSLLQKSSHLDHYHDPNNICCGIKVPSVFAVPVNQRIPIPLD